MKPKFTSFDDGECELCGAEFPGRVIAAEMIEKDPGSKLGYKDSSLAVHLVCGLYAGLEEL